MYVPMSLNLLHNMIFFSVICSIHSLVYKEIHNIVYQKKKENCSQDLCPVKAETPDLLYHFGGAAVYSMLKKRKALPRPVTESVANEIMLLKCLENSQKSNLPALMNDIDTSHGGFVVPHTSLLSFLQEADINVREFINDKNVRHYPNNVIKMATESVWNNEELKCLFMDCIEELDLCDILDSKSMDIKGSQHKYQ